MNKDKAIQLLERLQDPEPYEPMLTKDAYDAIQMAIDALSADGDTISRKAAIEAINKALDRQTLLNRFVRIVAIDAIKQLPPTQPERIKGQWIHKSQVPDTVRGYWATCSSCGRGSFGGGNFCRECGSDNRKEKEK